MAVENNELQKAFEEFCVKNNIPMEKDYNFYSDKEMEFLRKTRNLFYAEAEKYQKIIDEKILEKNNVLKYQNQYVCYTDDYNCVYMYVDKIERLSRYAVFTGNGAEIFGKACIQIKNKSINVSYQELDKLLIIDEEEYKSKIKESIENFLKKLKIN